MKKTQFLANLEEIRRQARLNLHQGPITKHYALDLETIYELLNSALATEIICTLRYKKHHFKAMQLGATIAAQEFLEHSNQEQQHADQIAERIVQLGGEPNYNPAYFVSHAHADYVDCDSVQEMVKENLVAERIAIDVYRAMIQFIGEADSTTRKLLEDILAVEEEHADDLLDLAAEYTIPLN